MKVTLYQILPHSIGAREPKKGSALVRSRTAEVGESAARGRAGPGTAREGRRRRRGGRGRVAAVPRRVEDREACAKKFAEIRHKTKYEVGPRYLRA